MNKRVGAESLQGIGGGTVSETSRKYLERAEDLCRKRRPNEAVPWLDKALEADPYNLDAYIQLAFISPNFDASVEVLKEAEYKGKSGRAKLVNMFGPRCFDEGSDQVGNFWTIITTRPYMRVLQALTRFYVEKEDFPNAAKTVTEMLRLCPGDNLGQREWMPVLLIKSGRLADALSFVQVWTDPARPDIPPRGGCLFKAPASAPFTPSQMEKLEKSFIKATFLYDAAYCAYKLWGRTSTLATQYLVLAAKLNPIVLVKVLGKAERQKTLNPSARTLNSPEDASDYLWLAQDIWMAQDVWDWVNSTEQVTRLLLKKCSRAGCSNTESKVAEFKRCSACHQVWYCTRECQKDDWKTHKQPCKNQQNFKATMKAITEGRPLPKDAIPFLGASADFSSDGISTRFYQK